MASSRQGLGVGEQGLGADRLAGEQLAVGGAAGAVAARARTGTTLDVFQEALGVLAGRYRADEVLTAVRHIPAREAEFRAMPGWVRGELAAAYRAKGIEKLYTHQAAAAELAHAGRNFVVVTPTASG